MASVFSPVWAGPAAAASLPVVTAPIIDGMSTPTSPRGYSRRSQEIEPFHVMSLLARAQAVRDAVYAHCVQEQAGKRFFAWSVDLKGGFDIVITDLEMPSMDGYQLLSAISLLPISKGRPPVIVASAMMDETLAQRRPELRQASVLLAKPVQPADLLKAVEKVLAARAVSG